MRLIDADKLKKHYSWWDDEERRTLFDQIVDAQPTVDAVPTEFIMENCNLEFVCDALTDDDEWCSKRCQYSEPPSECIHRYIDRIWRREHD